VAKFTSEEIEKKRNDYLESAHHFGAIMYLFRAVQEIVKRINDIELGLRK